MNNRVSSEFDKNQVEQRLLERANAVRRSDSNASSANVDRFLEETPTIIQSQAHSQFPGESPFFVTAPAAEPVAQPVSLEQGSYLSRRFAAVFKPGLSLKQRIRAVPLLGYGVSVITQLIQLPLTRQQHELRLDAIESAQIKSIDALRAQLAQLNQIVNQRIGEIEPVIQRLVEDTNANANVLDQRLQQVEKINAGARLHPLEMLNIGHRLMKLEQIEAERKLRQFSQLLRFSEKENQLLRAQVAMLQAQIQAGGQGQTSATLAIAPVSLSKATDELKIDDFFKEFENNFRGSKEEIKRRLKVYLPYLESAQIGSGSQVIDVGCGRGEWLELLAESNIPALGIDLNLAKVEDCIAQGLAAKAGDAITFLQQQEPGSIAAVTGFHLIEHLPFEVMLALFDAALKALRPGGLVIFETPNPENLLVGACNFYFDPTHLHPIVPTVAQFIAQQRGFSEAEILRLNPYPEDHHMGGNGDADKAINRYFFGPQDYALIARK